MNKFKLASFVCLLLALVLLPLLSACSTTEPTSGPKTLKIGYIVALTGPFSSEEVFTYRGAQMAAEWINEEGGITVNGQQYLIEVVAEDQKFSPEDAITAATALIESHKVKFIAGGIVPFQTVAVQQVTEAAGVLHCVNYVTGLPQDLNPQTPLTFASGATNLPFIVPAFQYLVEAYPNAKTIVMVPPEDPGEPLIFEAEKMAAEELGLTVIDHVPFPTDTMDFYPVVTKALAFKPDALNTFGLTPWQGGIIKAARELGFNGPIFSQNMTPITAIAGVAGKDAATDYFNFTVNAPDPNNPPMLQDIVTMWTEKGYEAKYGAFEPTNVPQGFNGVWLITQAIEAAQSLDPAEVAETWGQMQGIETSTGTAKMGGLETFGVNHFVCMPFALTRLMNGEVQHVRWVVPGIP